MPKTARTLEVAGGDATQRPTQPFRKQRFTVYLITGDDSLWPLIGADLSGDLILKQFDSVEELRATVPAGQPGIVLWDARKHGESAALLSMLAQHSTGFALVALDSNGSAGRWTRTLQQRQIVANVGLPFSSVVLGKALEAAREEVNTRMILRGDVGNAPDAPDGMAGAAKRTPWLPIGIFVAVLAAAGFVLTRHNAPDTHSPVLNPKTAALAVAVNVTATDEQVDSLTEKARQAMLDRHFIDPASGSALALYRDVLLIDHDNGEAQQGLQRLAEILIARVQSALDERRFDVALQSLEIARSIDPNDRRLPALDERIVSLRAEIGPAQISAALNAQNFDRAAQLIEEAARAKSLPAAMLAQLRDEVRRRRDEFDSARASK